MPTEFSQQRKDDSDRAHRIARVAIYPQWLKTDQLKFEEQKDMLTDERAAALDGEMAIDRLVKVTCPHLRRPLKLTTQERFRQPEYAPWQDMTITEWNGKTNRESELYKLMADFFMYGYFDQRTQRFIDCIVINVPDLKTALATGSVRFSKNTNKKQQSFFGIAFAELHRLGLVRFHLRPSVTSANRRASGYPW